VPALHVLLGDLLDFVVAVAHRLHPGGPPVARQVGGPVQQRVRHRVDHLFRLVGERGVVMQGEVIKPKENEVSFFFQEKGIPGKNQVTHSSFNELEVRIV